MKNFFKKLSFVLAVAMVLTSLTPATASAASKNFVTLKGSKTAVTSVYAWIGGVTRNLDYNINGKTSGVKGTWKSSKEEFVKVDAKTGVITPVANGSAYVTFTTADGKTTVKTVVKARTRAAALHIYDKAEYAAGNKVQLENKEGVTPSAIELKVGETKDLRITMPLSKKQQEAGAKKASYFTYAEVKDDSFVTAEPVADGDERLYTLTAKAPGETTVTIVANQSTLANVRKNKYFREATINVNVVDGLTITDLKASKVNVLTATFASPVDTDDVTVAVTRGTNTTASNSAVASTTTWSEDKTVATITTTAKMTAGTYTVTATSKADKTKKAEKSVEIQNQYVAELQILNDVALTGKGTVEGQVDKDAGVAYVYYKVLDQYGEDLTSSTSIQWSTSCGAPASNDRNIGKLTLRRTDGKAFTYGEQIYVTGVYTKTGISKSATLTVGPAQALDTMEMVGFIKKNTTTILQTLPSGFKSGEYYLVYNALDQNGNALSPKKELAEEVTFITDNVLVIKEVKGDPGTVVADDGREYNTICVQPGDYVGRGGEVNITAIATKTGKQTRQNYVVGQTQILQSFTMSSPSEIIADGEKIKIPFRALDQNGEEITNFVTLADNLNKLNFSVSVGYVVLKEENDGTAVLWYQDVTTPGSEGDWNSSSADGVDRTVSITSVVVGGGTDTLLLSISDKARPDAISAVDVDSVMVEGTEKKLGLDSFTFLDQYGRTLGELKDGRFIGGSSAKDNGFFANCTKISGVDYGSDTSYFVRVEYTGNGGLVASLGGISAALNTVSNTAIINTPQAANVANPTFITATDIKVSSAGNTFAFAIAKQKGTAEPENVSTTYRKNFTVVDIGQVRNFTVADFDKLYVKTDKSQDLTGKTTVGVSSSALTETSIQNAVSNASIEAAYEQKVTVKGTYNNAEVTIPAKYYLVNGAKVSATTNESVTLGSIMINTASGQGIKWAHFYDAGTASYNRKDSSDIVSASVYNIYSNGDDGKALGTPLALSTAAIQGGTGWATLRDTVRKNIAISDAYPVVTTINVPETYTVKPTDTKFTAKSILDDIEFANHLYNVNGHVWGLGSCVVEDQYGKAVYGNPNVTVTYKVSNQKETAGFADNNFTVITNDSTTTNVEGAERGDTFVLTITVSDGRNTVSKDILVTVGADNNATVDSSNENGSYAGGSGLKKTLDDQRKAALNIQ